jgi:hypothetical protein
MSSGQQGPFLAGPKEQNYRQARTYRLRTGEKIIQYLCKERMKIIVLITPPTKAMMTKVLNQTTTVQLMINNNSNTEHKINRKPRAFQMH